MIFYISVDVTLLQIGLSFLAAAGGALLGGCINIYIHKSSLKDIRIENDKKIKASEAENDSKIKAQISLEIIEFIKVKNIPKEEVANIVSDKTFQETVNIVSDLVKFKESIPDKSTMNDKKLDNDIIKTEGAPELC